MSTPILTVQNLCKRYPHFFLDDVSFELHPGITGFIGENGAGKTTTLSCLLDLVHPDSGEVCFFGKPYSDDPADIRQRVGYAAGTTTFYPHKPIAVLTSVTRTFYDRWDEAVYHRLMDRFHLDPRKTPSQLSSGMKVKYSIACALSYHAQLLILDEPTSGLDPRSRADLMELFLEIVNGEDVTILFSTQITSDLEDYADRIIYIREGRIAADSGLESFLNRYRLARTKERPPVDAVLGSRRIRGGWLSLLRADAPPLPEGQIGPASLAEIMVLDPAGEE